MIMQSLTCMGHDGHECSRDICLSSFWHVLSYVFVNDWYVVSVLVNVFILGDPGVDSEDEEKVETGGKNST